MKYGIRLISFSFLLAACTANVSYGLNNAQPEPDTRHCYGLAMVGMDSVINSRLGVLPEHVLDLALSDPGVPIAPPEEADSTDPYSPRLLRIIFDAYLWEGTPRDYAVQVFYACSLRASD